MSKTVIGGFFDARCSKCGARIGWYGTLADRPPYRRCSHAETINVSEEEKAILDNECFCMVQTLLYEHKHKLFATEKQFLLNMYKKYQAKQAYSDVQIGSIKRIYEEKEEPT